MKKLILAGLTIVIVTALFTTGLAFTSNFDFKTGSFKTNVNQQIDLPSFKSIDASLILSRFVIELSDHNKLVVVGSHHSDEPVEAYVKDNVLYIKEPAINNIGINFGSLTATLYVSSDLFDKITITNVSGSITIRDIQADSLSARTVSGSLRLSNVASEFLKVSSVSGAIDVTGDVATIDSSNTSGRISLYLENLRGDIQAKNVSGRIVIEVPSDSSFRASLKSVSGSLSSDIRLNLSEDSKRSLVGVAGSGDYRIDANNVSGSIKIEKRR